MSDVVIRRATEEDLDAVVDIYLAVAAEGVHIGGHLPLDREERCRAFGQTIADQTDGVSCAMFVAEVGGGVVGSLGVHNRNGLADLGMMLLDGHRGRGLGRRLMTACIDWAAQAGVHKLTLQHWPWNEPARRLYESVGFVEEGYFRRHWRRKDGSLWDAVQMGLVLDDGSPGHDERATDPPISPEESPER